MGMVKTPKDIFGIRNNIGVMGNPEPIFVSLYGK